MKMKKLAVLALAITLLGGAGCKQKDSIPNASQPAQQEQAAVINGPDGTVHPNNTAPDEWKLPVGEKFVNLLCSNNKNFLIARHDISNTTKLYYMDEETGTLVLSYSFKDGI